MRRGRVARLAGRARSVSATETATWTGSFPRLRRALYNPLRSLVRYRVTAARRPPRAPSRRRRGGTDARAERPQAAPSGQRGAAAGAPAADAQVRGLTAPERPEEALDGLEHRALEVEHVGDRPGAHDRLPHQQAARAARPQLRVGAAQQVVGGARVPHDERDRVDPVVLVMGGEQRPRAAGGAGGVEPLELCERRGRGEALAGECLRPDRVEAVERDVVADLDARARLADLPADVAAQTVPQVTFGAQALEPVGVLQL